MHGGAVLCSSSNYVPPGTLWTPLRRFADATCESCKVTAGNIKNVQSSDEGDWHKIESEQQHLWEGILSSLSRLTANDENYAEVYGGIGQIIIWHITDEAEKERNNPIHAPTDIERIRAFRLYIEEVDVPIRAFVGPDNEKERRYLLGLILEKLIPTIRTPSLSAYDTKIRFERRRR
jgi:hypothetical protein